MSWLNRRIIVILLRVHSNFTKSFSVLSRLDYPPLWRRKRADGCLRFEYYIQSGREKRDHKKKKKGEKEKKMEENGEKVGNTMKQNLFCVESCSQGLLVELSRFPSETNSTVLFFLFSSLFFFFFLFITNLLLCSTIYRLYYYIEENQDVHVNLKNFFRKLKLIN